MPQPHQPHRRPFTIVVLAVFSSAAFALAGPPPNDYDFDFVTVGAVGNAPYSGDSEGGNAGRGQVNYEYRIARTEVTTAQWMEFVNTFSVQGNDIAGPGRIFAWGAVLDTSYLGPGTRYKLNPAAPNAAMRPVIGISWRDCAQFVNWLNNDKSSSPDALTHGAYDTSTFTQTPGSNYFNDQLYHDPDAKYWIPTLDEWLKAAHYDPDKFGQGQAGWWEYSTMSDTPPTPGPPGVGQTSAGDPQGPGEPSPLGYPLGAYPDTVSPWGLLDVSGGASEWLEEPSPGGLISRGVDGARAGSLLAQMLNFDSAGGGFGGLLTTGGSDRGLRIASSVPTTGTVSTVIVALLATSWQRRRTLCHTRSSRD